MYSTSVLDPKTNAAVTQLQIHANHGLEPPRETPTSAAGQVCTKLTVNRHSPPKNDEVETRLLHCSKPRKVPVTLTNSASVALFTNPEISAANHRWPSFRSCSRTQKKQTSGVSPSSPCRSGNGGGGLGFRCLRRVGRRWFAVRVVKERNGLAEV